jgi:hypothetical protein
LPDPGDADDDRSPRDAVSLYDKLERVVVPLFYRDRERFRRRHATRHRAQRLLFQHAAHGVQYVTKAYFR